MSKNQCVCETKPEGHPCWRHSADGLCVITINRSRIWNPSACDQCWQFTTAKQTGTLAERRSAGEMLEGIKKGVGAHAGRVSIHKHSLLWPLK